MHPGVDSHIDMKRLEGAFGCSVKGALWVHEEKRCLVPAFRLTKRSASVCTSKQFYLQLMNWRWLFLMRSWWFP